VKLRSSRKTRRVSIRIIAVVALSGRVASEHPRSAWHGGTATTAMTHIAVQEALDGKAVDWMEHVTDEQ
jgi:hypothetical protein